MLPALLLVSAAQAPAQNVTAGPGSADPTAEFTFTVESDGWLSYSYFATPGPASRYGRKDLCGFARSGIPRTGRTHLHPPHP